MNPLQIFSTGFQKIQLKKSEAPKQTFKFEEKPDVFVKSVENVSFTGYKNDSVIRALGNIECPCCGVKMLKGTDLKAIESGIKNAPRSADAINVLQPYEEYMHPVEKQCFNLLKNLSKDKPGANFQRLFQDNMEPYHTKLVATQNKIMDEVDNLAKSLPKEEAKAVKDVTSMSRRIASGDEKEIRFKRKTFIGNVVDLQDKVSDKEIHAQMVKTAEKMPSASSDINAFVIKYAARSHGEIAQRLVSLSGGTIEHIKPQSEGGPDEVGNYLLECGGCNHTRSSIPLGDWVDEHPEMIGYTQQYMDKVIDIINKGGMKGFEYYPVAVKKTLAKESDGKLDVNIEALEPKNKPKEKEKVSA